jgi:hypothetical protein
MVSLPERIVDILENLDDNESLDALQIAKIIFGNNATQKQVNPTLYNLLKKNKVEKIPGSNGSKRPKWKIHDQDIVIFDNIGPV